MTGVNRVGAGASLRWLSQGWRDMLRAPGPCLVYGAAVAALSYGVWTSLMSSNLEFWALSLSCGFVFLAPMLAMGLYEAGRRIGDGERPTLRQMLFVRSAVRSDIFYFGLALLLIYLLWGRIAQVVYGLSTYRLHKTVPDFIDFAISTPDGHGMLIAGTLIGGVLAFFTFALSVVSAPMLLDQKANVFGAMFISLRAVSVNLPALLLWAFLITILLIACAASSWLGLILVFPWLGLASWRAYCDLVS